MVLVVEQTDTLFTPAPFILLTCRVFFPHSTIVVQKPRASFIQPKPFQKPQVIERSGLHLLQFPCSYGDGDGEREHHCTPQPLAASERHNSCTILPCLSSKASVAYSGSDGAILKADKRIDVLNSMRLSVKAAMEVDISKIVPQADRVLIRLEALESKSAGGVLLPKAAVKFDRHLQGEIIAAGSEVTEVEKGQKVMFADINAYEVNLETLDRLCFCRCGDLLAIFQ